LHLEYQVPAPQAGMHEVPAELQRIAEALFGMNQE
jgi:hypothetical protein